MSKFINYDTNSGLSINSYRKASATTGDIADLVIAVGSGDECVCCDLDSAKDALEDGAFWAGKNVSQEVIEEVHALITDYEKESDMKKFKMTAVCNPSNRDSWFPGFSEGREFEAADHEAALEWISEQCAAAGTDEDPQYAENGPTAEEA